MNTANPGGCGVAVVGCGTVGGGVATLLTRDGEALARRVGRAIELRHVVDIHFDHARAIGLDEGLWRLSSKPGDYDKVLADPDVHVVCELIGGLKAARVVIEKAIAARKHVVTANKALLAHAGVELFAQARQAGVTISFEASCGGGIPIIRALYDGLIANRIDALYGIVNGTCNYILSSMTQQGKSYAQALKEAQAGGLAEADPTLDVAGTDSAHKLCILAGLAFGGRVDVDAIPVRGIDQLELCDILYGQELGYVVKLLAIAQRQGDGVALRVQPAFISQQHPLAWVNGPFNAVSVYGHATGHTMYYGRGAGAMPTASAVVADLVSVATGTAARVADALSIWPDRQGPQRPAKDVHSRYYIRLLAEDRPGVFAQIASILAEHNISISSVLQHEPAAGEGDKSSGGQCGHNANGRGDVHVVPVIITTHRSAESSIAAALAKIEQLGVIHKPPVCLEIVDEHTEAV